jgi:hypothetical protein
MKTQNRKAKKPHTQINEGFVRYSFSEYVHRQGDEQFDEFTGIGKALGGMWNKLTQNQRPGGAPRASAPAAPAPAAQRPSAPAAAPEQKPSSFTPDQAKIAKIKSRNVHLTRVEKSFDDLANVLQEPRRGEDIAAISGMNVYVKERLIPALKNQFRPAIDKKWKLLDNETPNDVSRSGGMISAMETNPEGGDPRGSGSPKGAGSAKDQISKSAGSYFDRLSGR